MLVVGEGGEDVMAAAENPARNLACLLKYESIAATDYCLCVAGVTANFACNVRTPTLLLPHCHRLLAAAL
jgi:hypothetical protein